MTFYRAFQVEIDGETFRVLGSGETVEAATKDGERLVECLKNATIQDGKIAYSGEN